MLGPRLEPPQAAPVCSSPPGGVGGGGSDGKSPLPSAHPLSYPPRFTSPTQEKRKKSRGTTSETKGEGSKGTGKIGTNEEREKAGDPVKFPR